MKDTISLRKPVRYRQILIWLLVLCGLVLYLTSVRVKQIEVEQSPCEAKASWVDGNKLPDHQGG